MNVLLHLCVTTEEQTFVEEDSHFIVSEMPNVMLVSGFIFVACKLEPF